jgi:hypothetical protein
MLVQPNSTDGFHSLAGTQEQLQNTRNTNDADIEVSVHGPERDMVLIGESEIGQHDVICGRSKMAFNNVGNRRFRTIISLSLERFMKAPERKDKSVVIRSVTDLLLGNGGRFLQQVHKNKSGRRSSGIVFYELTKKETRIKVGHALRDMALAASRAEELAWRSVPATNASSSSSAVVTAASNDPSSPSSSNESNEPHEAVPFESNPLADRRLSSESILSESVFESLVQLVAESNNDASSLDFTDDSFLSAVGENAVGDTEMIIPSHITTVTVSLPTEGLILSAAEGSDSLDDNILSWLVDESTNLLDV